MATFPISSRFPPLIGELELSFSTIMRAQDTVGSPPAEATSLSAYAHLSAIQTASGIPRSDSFGELLGAIQRIADGGIEASHTDGDFAAVGASTLPPLPPPPPLASAGADAMETEETEATTGVVGASSKGASSKTGHENTKTSRLRQAYTFGGRPAPATPKAAYNVPSADADGTDIAMYNIFPIHALQLERPEFTAWRRANGVRKLSPKESKRLSQIRRGVLAKVYAERSRRRREGEMRKVQVSMKWLRASFSAMSRKVIELERGQVECGQVC